MNYQNLYLFIKVLEKGSFVAAAKAMDIPTSTLSRRVMQLEQDLGYRLLHRSARKLSLTEAGENYYRRCQPLFAELEDVSWGMDAELSSPSGVLRVTAPVALSTHLLQKFFFEFMHRYPNIQLELSLVNQNIDLEGEGIDVAFRMGEVRLNSWVSRSLFQTSYTVCASPDYLKKSEPVDHPQQLLSQELVVSRRMKQWTFQSLKGETYVVSTTPRFRTDDIKTVVDAVEAGLGIGYLPNYLIDQQLHEGTLVGLMDEWLPLGREVHILYPDRRFLPNRVRLFIEYMLECLQLEPSS